MINSKMKPGNQLALGLTLVGAVYPNETVEVGYRVCRAFDRGGDVAAIQEVMAAYNRDDSSSREYYATLFAQSAAFELCPEHNGEIGPI